MPPTETETAQVPVEDEAGDGVGESKEQPKSDGKFGVLLQAGYLEDDDSDEYIDVVAVHGLYGDRVGTWTGDGANDMPGSNWLGDQLFYRQYRSRILAYGYDASNTRSGIFTRAGIREKALRLLDELVELRKTSKPECLRSLAFIAHDLGGIIVKEALCIAAREHFKYRNIANSARLLVFFGCPHRCTSTLDMEDNVANLLFATEDRRPADGAGKIKQLAKSVIEINGSFHSSSVLSQLDVVNIYSEEPNTARKVFSRYATSLGVAFEERIGSPRPHKDMCKFAEGDGLLDRIDSAMTRHKPFWRQSDPSGCLQTLRSLAAPTYPLEVSYDLDHQFNWITRHETYTKWFADHGPSILHIHGATGVSDASEYIFQHLDADRATKQNDEIVIYFTFDRNDDRRNSVLGMLNTLLAQIFSHNQAAYASVKGRCEQMAFHRSWTQADLSLLFVSTLSSWDHGGISYVINGLDECDDSRKGFLKDLFTFASLTESSFKIVITSTNDPVLQAALGDWSQISLDSGPDNADIANTYLASDIDNEVLELTQQRPVFCGFEKAITDRLLECGQDKCRRRMVLNQLRHSKGPSTKSAARQELVLLAPTTSRDIFAQILASVPSAKRIWARKVLTWVLYAFYPLGISELSIALALEAEWPPPEDIDLDELVNQCLIDDLDDIFKGMLMVKHGEVHLCSPEAREFFLAVHGQQERVWYDVKDTAHQQIADTCLLYLSLRPVQESIIIGCDDPLFNPTNLPTHVPRYSLRDYAIHYWPNHYKLITEKSRPTQRTLACVMDKNFMHSWFEAYWWSSNPIRRTDRFFLSLLPILAGLGVEELVSKWLGLDAEPSDASQDRASALIEAAREARLEVVRRLLLLGGYNQASLQDALIAAVSCCDEAVLHELVEFAITNIENFEWPPAVLCRTAQHGLEKLVKRLLESGASVHKAITFHGATALHLAAQGGHVGVVKILLEHGASLTAVTLHNFTPLHMASIYGYAAVVRLLIDADASADINAVDDESINSLYFACIEGNYQVVGILAEAGADMSKDKKGDWSPLIIVATKGFIKSARFLLQNKAVTEIKGRDDWTPLRYAATRGRVELCRLLLEYGADVNNISTGEPILSEIASEGKLELVKLFVEKGASIDAVNSDGWTALQKASANGHISVVACLLDHGADVNYSNKMGHTSVLLAAQSGHEKIVQLLIDKGADIHRETEDGWTAIHLSYDHAETVRVLLENGADANRIMRQTHYTALYLAASQNCIESLKVLLSFDADLDIPTSEESYHPVYTPLSVAAVNGYNDIVRLLLEAGANINKKSEHNNVPLQFAVGANREDLVRTIMEYNPQLGITDDDGDTALHCLTPSTSLMIAKLLVNGGSEIEARNKEGNTPLCKAVEVENLEIVSYLIAKKAKLDVVGGKYGGPLHIACRWSNLELVKILLAAGADVNLVDSSSSGTPIQSACRAWAEDDEKHESIIRYLIDDAKADVTVVGGLQGCALSAACGWSTPDMVKLILEKGAKVNVKDGMGRVAMHFAATKSLDHFELVFHAGADVEMMDKMGRTAIHWATIGGSIDVVERVLSLSRQLIDQADIDGWTPLLWASRGCGTAANPLTSAAQEKIITLLLDRGANPCVKGKVHDEEWSVVKLARYHGVDKGVVQLMIDKIKEKLAAEGNDSTWDEESHASKKALDQTANCDSCLSGIFGLRYKCETCLDFDFCYKCYRSQHLLHPGHPFKGIGLEFWDGDEKEEEDELEEDEGEATSTDEDDYDDENDEKARTPGGKADVNEDSDDEDSE